MHLHVALCHSKFTRRSASPTPEQRLPRTRVYQQERGKLPPWRSERGASRAPRGLSPGAKKLWVREVGEEQEYYLSGLGDRQVGNVVGGARSKSSIGRTAVVG